ncbi:MAG: molybdopterin-synthase adenylyltransferase MoeB [Rhizobiaceae bacterium]|jgi:molybdopterin/thiamine biosynthesis adenylyltransferase|nr:molybdopterin-synthase adenylyltransferase MoeB [Rhizobiaceae bacterium]
MSAFSAEEIERYRRHLVLAEIGGAGQQALKSADVAVLGAGGLGAPVIAMLAAAGVGRLTLIDHDTVSLSNLQRQFIHRSVDDGAPKVDSATRFVDALNPHVAVVAHAVKLNADNAARLIAGATLAIDGSDNFAARRAVAAACEAAVIPLVTGAVNRFDGAVSVIAPHLMDAKGRPAPRFADLYPEDPPEGMLPACAEIGVAGPVTGVIGTLMAMEAIKLITGAGEPLIGRVLTYDGLGARFSEMRYRRG